MLHVLSHVKKEGLNKKLLSALNCSFIRPISSGTKGYVEDEYLFP